jgi:Zn-dependent peptidase ImmA (M78 family)
VLKRGFKNGSEKKSLELRRLLNLKPHEYLSARELASYYKVKIITPEEVPRFDKQCIMKLLKYDVWSAVTLKRDNTFAIILNTDHSIARQESDLFHELAHIVCGHDMSGFVKIGDTYFRRYNKEQEEEAEWLGGCLHIPRKCLEWAFRSNMSPQDISNNYTASDELVTYRINVTGIKNQYRYYASKFL